MKTYLARVEAVLLADQPDSFVTRRVPQVSVELGGIPTDRHYGLLVPADSRQQFYKRGTMIANRRQISIVSEEECTNIAANLGIQEVLPEWLGANLLLKGLPELTMIPQGARFLFPSGMGLICEGENLPCIGPGKVIGEALGMPELAKAFVRAAGKLRGIVCSVECEGAVYANDEVRVVIP